jgi:hypothetical protein
MQTREFAVRARRIPAATPRPDSAREGWRLPEAFETSRAGRLSKQGITDGSN